MTRRLSKTDMEDPLKRIAEVALLPFHLVVAIAAAILLLPVWLLPWDSGIRVGRAYGLLAAVALPRYRRVAMINVRRAYGSAIDRAEARRTAWRVFANMGQSLAEGLQFVRRLRAGSAHAIAYDIEDAALDERLRADPRPKIFVTGHLGSWEVMTLTAARRHGTPGAVIARRVDNPFVDRLFRRLRVPAGAGFIEKRGATGAALRRLRAGESVAMLIDENAGWRGVFVDFFGRPASTSRLPALLSLMTGAPIVLGAAVRAASPPAARFRYRLAVFEPRAVPDGGEVSTAVRDLTQAFTRQFERWARDDPQQWRWIHWRWKTRPGGVEETYSRRDLEACFAESGNRSSRGVAPRLSGTPTATD